MSLNDVVLSRLVRLLAPLMVEVGQRRALVTLAIGIDSERKKDLLNAIEYEGAAQIFVVNLVSRLYSQDGITLIYYLLRQVREMVGEDQVAHVDALIHDLVSENAEQTLTSVEQDKRSLRLFVSYAHKEIDTSLWESIHADLEDIEHIWSDDVAVTSEVPINIETEPRCEQTRFSAFYPRTASIRTRSIFLVYVHLLDALELASKDALKFKEEFGGGVPTPRSAKTSVCLAPETLVTVYLECKNQEFEPLILTKKWRPPFTRFEFDFVPNADLSGDTVIVQVRIQAFNVEIARIENCAIEVIEPPADQSVLLVALENPLAQAKLASQSTTLYQRIFISYSRKDSDIALAYKAAQVALGNEVFLDVDSLRAGQDWKAQLARAIDEADILQLFWSENSSQSEYCRYEWDYALNYRCTDTNCVGFIRPVYWRTPLPPPPQRLSHLNFRYVPLEKPHEYKPKKKRSKSRATQSRREIAAKAIREYSTDDVLQAAQDFIHAQGDEWVNFSRVSQHLYERFYHLKPKHLGLPGKKYKSLLKFIADYPDRFALRSQPDGRGVWWIKLTKPVTD